MFPLYINHMWTLCIEKQSWSCVSSKHFYKNIYIAAAGGNEVDRNSLKICLNVYEGLTFYHLKFYHYRSIGF